MKNIKGITLISLVVTIMVLGILASIATYNGVDIVQSSKFTKFSTELKIMQTQVNNIYERTKNGELNKDKIGQSLTATNSISQQATKVFTSNESGITSSEGYRYWDIETIKNLGIEGVEQEFFINLNTRSVVSYQGFEYQGDMYYTLNQIPNGLYNVDYDDKNINIKPTFDIAYTIIEENKFRVNITNIKYDGYIDKWQVQYKLQEKDYWNTSDDLSFTVDKDGIYEIKIVNGNVESEEKTILLVNEYVSDGLLVHYDGINNTGNGDYQNNEAATVWKDLSGNNNDGIFHNMNTDKGYYSKEDKGYVFLHNDAYIETTNNIGLSRRLPLYYGSSC